MSISPTNSLDPAYMALRHKNLKGLPNSITCYALNYLIHKLFLCTKETVYLYDLTTNYITHRKNYSKDLSKLYENDIEIRSVDVVLLSNLWVALINKKSFMFFNNQLEFSRIYTISPNPLLSLQVVQRTNDLLTIREDRKAIQLWKFELTENLASEKKVFDLQTDREHIQEGNKDNINSYKDRVANNSDKALMEEKERQLKELGRTFEVNLFIRKQLHLPQNRFLIRLAFSEELKILAISLDNAEVVLYHLACGDLLQTLSFGTPSPDRDLLLVAHVSIDQEMLYYCDDKRITVYDLIRNEELTNHQHGLAAKFMHLYTERSNNTAGVYLLTTDEKLHVYSIDLKRPVWTLALKYLDSANGGVISYESSKRGYKSALSYVFNPENKHSIVDSPDSNRREIALREKISKSKCIITADMSNSGLMTLFIFRSGIFQAFDIMSPARVLYESKIPIENLCPIWIEEAGSPDIFKKGRDEELQVRIKLTDHTIVQHSLSQHEESELKSVIDFLAMLRQNSDPASSPTAQKEAEDELNPSQIRQSFVVFEEKLFIVVTQTQVHVMSWRCNKVLSQNLITGHIVACTTICLSPERFGSFYVLLGTNKGVIIILECDFALKALNIIKQMPKHEGVLSLRYLKEYNSLLSIGTEGNINLYSVTRPSETNIFPTQQFHRLIWNQVTTIDFFSDTEIIAGLDNGVVQYAKFSWKTDTNLQSKLFEYHHSPIKHISTIQNSQKYFVAACEDNVISLWTTSELSPLKVFQFAKPIISIFLNFNLLKDSIELYLASETNIFKLDYEHGGYASIQGRDDDLDWDEALSERAKYNMKILREGNTVDPLVDKMINLLNQHKNGNRAILPDGPLMTQYFYNNPHYHGLRTLEADYFRYIGKDIASNHKKGSFIWILDTLLDGYHKKKIQGEPLTSKKEMKTDKKSRGKGQWTQLLGKTLKKYPVIKSIIAERERGRELEESHKNMILLLNLTYHGEDDTEHIYKFLEQKYGIKRSEIDDAYFFRAKQLYYKKPIFNNVPRGNISISSESPHLKPSSKEQSSFLSKSKIKLPTLNIEKSVKQTDFSKFSGKVSRSKLHTPAKANHIQHFKNNSESVDLKTPNQLLSPYSTMRFSYLFSPLITNVRNWSKPLKIPKEVIEDTRYKGYRSGRVSSNQNLKLTLNFSFTPSPGAPSVLSSLISARTKDTEKLGIGSDENTLRSPFFLTSRGELNKDVFYPEPHSRKTYANGFRTTNYFNNTTTSEMFKRTNKDFVALHSKGFQSKENVDLFNHVLRLLLKNHHILKVKPEYARKTKNISRRIQDQELDRDSDDGEEVDEDDVEYVPIEIKQFVLETSQKEIGMLDHIITMYEQKTGLNLNSHETVKKEEEYSSHKLEEEMTQENEFLEEILKQVNEKGVESVNLNQMIRFRQIMKRRLEVFSRLQAHIEVSGLLRTKPVTAREAKLKEELRQTFLQVKQITALKSVFHFAEPLVKATSPMSFNSLNHIMSPRDSLGSPWSPFNGGPKDPDMMASAIRRSLETARTLERTARGYNKEFDTEPAVLELESLESYDESSRGIEHSQRKVVRSLTSLTPVAASARTWGKGDDFSMKISEESFEGKKPSLQAVVSRVKRKRRLSIPLPTKNERRIQRGETKIGTVLTEGERQRRLERLLSKHPEPPPMYIDEERDLDLVKGRGQKKQNKMDMHREIERAWKEKDFGFLKAYLIGDLDKKNIKDNSDEEEGGTKRGKDDEKKNLRKKKKKRNPNVSTSSGSVITMTANKLKKGFTKNAREGDGTFDGEKDDYGDDDGIEEEEEDEDLFSRHYLMKAKTQEPPILRRNTFRIDIDKTFKNNKKQNNIQRSGSLSHERTTSVDRRSKIIEESPRVWKEKSQDKVKKKPLVKKKSAGGSPRAETTGSSPTKDEVIKNLKDKSKDAKILIKKSKKLESQLSVLPTVTDEKYGLGNIALEIASEDKSKMNTLLETSYKEKNLDFLDKTSNNQKNESSDTNQSKLKQNTSLEKTLKEIKEEIIAENKPKENKLQKEEEKLTDSNVSKRDEEGVKKNMKKSLVKSILKKDNSKKDLSISITAFSKKSEEDSSMELMKPTNNMKKGKSFSSKSSKKSLLVKEDKEDLEDGDDSPPHLGTLTRGKTEGHLTKYLKPKSKVSKFAKEKGKDKETLSEGDEGPEEKKEELIKEKKEFIGRKRIEPNKSPKSVTLKTEGDEVKPTVEVVGSPKLETFTPFSPTAATSDKTDNTPKPKSHRPKKKEKLTEVSVVQGEEAPNEEETLPKIDEVVPEEVPVRRKQVEFHKETPEPEVHHQIFKRRVTRNNLAKDANAKDEEDILEDPLKLFQAVLNVEEVDQETKLDLFIYGNRKEALKDFVKEVEETIEHHILKQGDCNDQLSGFFDTRMKTLLQLKPPLHYSQPTQSTDTSRKRSNRKESTKIDFEEPLPSHLLRRSFLDVSAEKARKHAFQQHHLLINTLKNRDRNKCTPLSQGLIGGSIETKGNMRKGQILLSQDVIQTLLHTKCETLLEAQNLIDEADEDEEDDVWSQEEREERALLTKLEMIRKLLIELKKRDPPRFRDLLRMFYENKRLYELVLEELDYNNNRWIEPLN